ncbi:MAG TPA: amidohydrolase [Limnochordales bacterium]
MSGNNGVHADTLLINGRIWPGGAARHTEEALAVWQGRVLAIGRTAELEPLAGPDTQVIDLRGRVAIPGFNDAHAHPLPLGLNASRVDVGPQAVRSIRDIQAKIRQAAAARPPGTWILASGYDDARLAEGRHPTRAELDEAAPLHPVFVTRRDLHMGVANTRALEAAGITPDEPDPPGGMIQRVDGQLTGLLAENAMQRLLAHVPPPTLDELVEAIAWCVRELNRWGITSITDAGVGMTCGADDLKAYFTARQRGLLTVRFTLCLLGDESIGGRPTAPAVLEAGLGSGFGDEYLRVGPVKFFADGSASGRTAAFSQPYLDGKSYGILTYSLEDLIERVRPYHRRGWQVAIHAIGDAAAEQVLQAYEAVQREFPRPGARHRIEHCGYLQPGHVERLVQAGAVPVPQPVFMHVFGDGYLRHLDEARVHGAYPMRRFLEAGLMPSASSDAPIAPVNPFLGLYAMLTRTSSGGRVFAQDQCLDIYQALTAYTLHSAYTTFDETRKGLLAPGFLADVAVLSRDIFAASPDQLPETGVDLTLCGGRIVYDRLGETAAAG